MLSQRRSSFGGGAWDDTSESDGEPTSPQKQMPLLELKALQRPPDGERRAAGVQGERRASLGAEGERRVSLDCAPLAAQSHAKHV